MGRWIKIVEDSGVTTVVNVDTVTGITHYPHRNPHHNMFELYIPVAKSNSVNAIVQKVTKLSSSI